ncbi:uncharacterized protein BJ171DRAFT_149432 [Polychytrium aggregatum]|uniref:uncharacterized protein n=1 Tax=Polychytrium aggregatum TaxID=110093 RepID=UPI0022FE195D|nr:uncharacterized protein BJ171DRAFT_149432 [Polychytrium aggregatum]KAI9203290.1 hypothetical protein BJ171DRAFT_149432 [Polychytrium aggregatum]
MFHQSSRTSAAIAGTLARTPLVTPDKGEVQATSPPHLPAPIGPAGPLSQPEGSEFAQEPADTGEKIRKERGLADTNATKPSTTTPDGAVAGACSITHVGTDSTIRAKAVVVCPTPTITDAITDTNTDAGTGSGRIEQPSSFPGPSNLEAIAERSATGLDQLSHPPPAALASARVTPPSETTAEHRQDRGRLLGGLSRLFKSHHHDGLVALMLEELNGLSVDGESLFIESPNPEQGAREQVKDIVGKLQAVLSGRVAEKNTRLKILGERLAESLDAAAALQERCQTLAAQVQMLQAAQTKDRACAATPDPPTGSDGTKTCTAPDGDGACSKDLLLRVLVEQQTALQTRLAILQQQLAHRRDAGPTRGALWQVQGQSLWLAFPL